MLVNLYATVVTLPAFDFPHTLRGRRDESDPAMEGHLNGFIGYVMDGGKRPMTATRYALYRHIQRVRHHLSVECDAPEALADWCVAANAIQFHPDGSVRDAAGAVLCAEGTGAAAPEARLPYPADAQGRKAANTAGLAAHGIAVPASLPPVVGGSEVVLRTPEAVLARATAVFLCAVRAESVASGTPIPAEELEARLPRGAAALSPREADYLAAAEPDDQATLNFTWGYEALAVLVWALQAGGLPFPAAIVDVSALARTMLESGDAAWAQSPTLRPTAELLDTLDLHYRLHWATTEARQQRSTVPGVVPGVVMERHRALNWLTRFEGADWDDVDTPT